MPINKPALKTGTTQLVTGGGGERIKNYELTDLLQTSLSFNVMAKSPYAADSIANEVFMVISAYREWFKEKGVHKVTSMRLGKENIVKIDSVEVSITVVPIEISFLSQETLTLSEKFYNARVYCDNEEIYENTDFIVQTSGTQILLTWDPPAGAVLSIDYIDAITLEEITNATLIQSIGNDRLYTVPDNGTLYGYYHILSSIELLKDSTE